MNQPSLYPERGPGLIVDLFAGGGGASVGISAALGLEPDIAVNHDPIALAVHEANHPWTRHLQADVWEVDPREATGGRPVWLLWSSPDCTGHSKAKGGKPRDRGQRSLADVVVKWARAARPAVVLLENVEEFEDWGPLDDDGQPIAEQKGREFRRWLGELRAEGYRVEWRILDASRYGAPTSRRRLFLVARCDGLPIEWPEPTHGGQGQPEMLRAFDVIDLTIKSEPVYERRRQLADRTLERIKKGCERWGGLWIMKYYGSAVGQSIWEPLHTITAVDRFGLVSRDDKDRVTLRMLQPHELLRAQFGQFADGYSLEAAPTRRDKIRLIGNSVAPEVARALVEANLSAVEVEEAAA